MSQIAVVTGITGFVAAHVALTFLKNGWIVRGTLRSDSKRSAVLGVPEYEPYVTSGKLELYTTGPLESGDYTEVLKGATAVVHTASPVEFGDQEFRESHLKPALQGTRGVLEAAVKETSVKAVVMTSTIGAVGTYRKFPTDIRDAVFNEESWNPDTIEDMDQIVAAPANERNKFAFPDGYLFYMAGKKYAELEAWRIQKESGAKWTLATINPAMVWGPSIQPMTSLSNGGMSTEFIWKILNGPKDEPVSPTFYPYYVDVREVAEAHYQAVVRGAQGRFILTAGTFDNQEMSDLARGWYPNLEGRIALGTPGKYAYKDPGVYTLENTKSQRELGIKYRPKEETFKDAMDRMLELEKQGLN